MEQSKGWGPAGLTREEMVGQGWLTEDDWGEVEEITILLARRVREGTITWHFAEWILRRLAQDKRDAWGVREAHRLLREQ